MPHSESSKLLECPRITFFLGIHAILQYITVILPSFRMLTRGKRFRINQMKLMRFTSFKPSTKGSLSGSYAILTCPLRICFDKMHTSKCALLSHHKAERHQRSQRSRLVPRQVKCMSRKPLSATGQGRFHQIQS